MLKNKKKVWVIFLLILLLAIAFVYFLFWLNFYRTNTVPFTSVLDSLGIYKEVWETDRNVINYRIHDESNAYTFTIDRPRFLRFEGNFTVLTPTIVDFVDDELVVLSEYSISLRYSFRYRYYVLNITDYTTLADSGDIDSMGSLVDRDGQPIGHPDDTEQFLEEWLTLFDKYNESIVEMFSFIKELFGESAFR